LSVSLSSLAAPQVFFRTFTTSSAANAYGGARHIEKHLELHTPPARPVAAHHHADAEKFSFRVALWQKTYYPAMEPHFHPLAAKLLYPERTQPAAESVADL